MAEKGSYTITRAEVTLKGGIKVVADVDSAEGIRALAADLEAAGLGEPVVEKGGGRPNDEERRVNVGGDPASMIETQAGLDAGRLAASKIMAIKDGVPQILQKSQFSTVTDAVLVLMFALEVGLKQNPVNYEDFAALFEDQNLKSGSPLSMLVTNLRNSSYFDNRAYADGRRLRLTAKGEQKAIEVLKKAAASGGKSR